MKKSKPLHGAIRLAYQAENELMELHPELIDEIEADMHDPVIPHTTANNYDNHKHFATHTPSQPQLRTGDAHTGESIPLSGKISKKKRYYTQNDIIELLDESGLDFTTQQTAFIIRIYFNEVRSKKEQQAMTQYGNNNNTNDDDQDEIDELPRPKQARHDQNTTTTTDRPVRQFYSDAALGDDSATDDDMIDTDDEQPLTTLHRDNQDNNQDNEQLQSDEHDDDVSDQTNDE